VVAPRPIGVTVQAARSTKQDRITAIAVVRMTRSVEQEQGHLDHVWLPRDPGRPAGRAGSARWRGARYQVSPNGRASTSNDHAERGWAAS
jgi:hypothetical protein